MKEKDRELMERYIYEVARHVRREQREETAMELRELISDMAETASMEEVLQKLGDPAEFARQYREENRHVIGPEYYDNYIWVLKIVCLCVLGSAVLSSFLQGLQAPGESGSFMGYLVGGTASLFGGMIANAAVSLISAFGAVTLIFAVLEYQHVKVELKEKKNWTVEELDKNAVPKKVWTPRLLGPVPDKRALISRSDSIVTIIFIVLLSCLFILAPQLFGAYAWEEGEFIRTIPVFNLEVWPQVLPVLLAGFLIGFIDEMIRLVTGRYCMLVLVSNLISGVLQVILGAVVLKWMPVWNPDFQTEIAAVFGTRFHAKQDFFTYFGSDFFSNLILGIIVAATMLELGVTIYKTLRYGMDRKRQYPLP